MAEEVEEVAVVYLAYGRGEVKVERKGYSLFATKRHSDQGNKSRHSAGREVLHHAGDAKSSLRGF
jgi:membrane protein required for beta-lactamase induction